MWPECPLLLFGYEFREALDEGSECVPLPILPFPIRLNREAFQPFCPLCDFNLFDLTTIDIGIDLGLPVYLVAQDFPDKRTERFEKFIPCLDALI